MVSVSVRQLACIGVLGDGYKGRCLHEVVGAETAYVLVVSIR